MPEVYIGIGSNVDRDLNIRRGLEVLEQEFGRLRLSPVYLSEAIGFAGDDFLNLVAAFDTQLSVAELSTRLRQIERDHGRPDHAPKFSARALDLDILLYGDACGLVDGIELPRGEVLYNAFVLKPLVDLAPEGVHPGEGQTFHALWQALSARTEQRLTPYPLEL
ncbi:2-amino-4-hydroxy-6-hydroxymethyldihydropteridine diphosphokinase [Litorivivens lipolytica]|uniref:2-amino-4-hydroxy-6-hydroxymethyldihydropteridine diphosphokinase n=1 Tax=Litorivivens lipolytica TaxID=1524264 RepID=A0A7W4Z636_9GAMM|nr:2-amino-4-hydroxy-6-hydroxymethyldihydropteridine diphosphokinase [Litorivivens lipolytica]MBB3048124.1 2-amino-4-hydroxy-6-hydroxymethyldihydropteridine diphosphokinase [Litorivivens lipolytica]